MKQRFLKYFVPLGLLIFAVSCEDEHFSAVPDVPVNTYFYLGEEDLFIFDSGMSIAFDETYGGYAGIILYCVIDGVYNAYDLCCPIHYKVKEKLELDGAQAFCTTDSVSFSLLTNPSGTLDKEGNPAYLKSYETSLNGNMLTVKN